jgi:hypothetical protein
VILFTVENGVCPYKTQSPEVLSLVFPRPHSEHRARSRRMSVPEYHWGIIRQLSVIALLLIIITQIFLRGNRHLPPERLILPVSHATPAHWGPDFMSKVLGCSVIPLIGGGDAQRAKRPAVRWTPYRSRVPSPAEMACWFGDGRCTAYGVVCGSVSRLVVLDLDDPALALAFFRHFPQLTDTLVVRSGVRGSPHLYWRVDFPVRSRAFPGGDLKAEGGYVVGPGSRAGGLVWEVVSDRPVRHITPHELAHALRFLGVDPQEKEVESRGSEAVTEQVDFVVQYHALAVRWQSRNCALFHSVCSMRDLGYPEDVAVTALAQVHALKAPLGRHLPETYDRRYAEALRTIRSVYQRSPRRHLDDASDSESVSHFPNSAREKLLNLPGGCVVARLLEGAAVVGLASGSLVSEADLCRALSGILSRDSIRKALNASYPDKRPVFAVFPPCTPPAGADTYVEDHRQKNAFLSGGQKHTKRLYRLPSAVEVCMGLKVPVTPGDPVGREAISSARAYRQALHKALIERRPGRYSQSLLAHRLNVSARTIRRYNAQLGIHSQPTYDETPLQWSNLDSLPLAGDVCRYGIEVYGHFLLDDEGKRWPVRREIAAQLLAQKRRVSYVRQGVNSYWCGPLPAARRVELRVEKPPPASVVPTQPVTLPTPAPAAPPLQCPENALQRPLEPFCGDFKAVSHNATKKAPERRSRRFFRRPLPRASDEQLAMRVHQAVPGLSQYNARRLVDTYGCVPVEATLRKLNYLRAQDKISNPAGFMITATRVSWRVHHGADQPGMAAPRFVPEPARRPRSAAYVAPPDDPLWQSTSYRLWRMSFFGPDDPYYEPFESELPY